MNADEHGVAVLCSLLSEWYDKIILKDECKDLLDKVNTFRDTQ
jgi:hypothetical protein